MRHFQLTSLLPLSLLFSSLAISQEFDEKFDHWPNHHTLRGAIVILNEVQDTQQADQAIFQLTGKEDSNIVVAARTGLPEQRQKRFGDRFTEVNSISFLDLSVALTQDQNELLNDATGIYLTTVSGENKPAPIHLKPIIEPIRSLINRGGLVAVDGDWAGCLSIKSMSGDKSVPEFSPGLGLLPDSIVETRFSTNTDRLRLKSALVSYPRSVGIGINKETALVLQGRKCQVIGKGSATFFLAANTRLPQREQTIGSRQPGMRPTSYLVDLTEWRRDAIDRTLPPFPSKQPRHPFVRKGTLVIVGGGGMPRNLMSDFVDMAGGKEMARLVYIPCSEQWELPAPQRTVEMWKKMGVKSATFLHTKDRLVANADQDFLKPLADATGIWFGGGRQWNFADSYYGTQAHRMMKEVLLRGGVIGGSSAGASIQARYLARATPIENFRIMAPGYERGGLGFISGVAIDQHFTQRGRQKDMTQLMATHPQLLGIGLDEATAIIVRQSTARVVGRGKAHFYDRRLPIFPDQPDYIALPEGSTYHLAEREILFDATAPKTDELPDQPDADGQNDPATPVDQESSILPLRPNSVFKTFFLENWSSWPSTPSWSKSSSF